MRQPETAFHAGITRSLICAMQFVDHRRFTVVHLRLRREAFDDQTAEVIDVTNRDVDLEIVDTGHMEHAEHLGERTKVPVQPPERLARVFDQPDRDQRLQPDAERGARHLGMRSL
jgi:hypothetical protein